MPKIHIVAHVPPVGGPTGKYRGLEQAFNSLGWETACSLLAGKRALTAQLASAVRLDTDVLYVRHDPRLPFVVQHLLYQRTRGTRIVLEVPTPVATTVRRQSPASRLPQRAWSKVVPLTWRVADVVIQYGDESDLWKRYVADRLMRATNGVDAGSFPIAPGWKNRTTCHMLAVANVSDWHGYDRIIRGMAGDGTSTLSLVGDGVAMGKLFDLVSALRLHERIAFKGVLTGAALSAEFAMADCAVSSLGLHRIGAEDASPLKTREYIARGLPVVFAGRDPDLFNHPLFAHRVQSNDDPVDVGRISDWLNALRGSPTGAEQIHDFAARRLDYKSKARELVNFLDRGRNEFPVKVG